MSNPQCPEPVPFSDVVSDYADIDFNVKSPPVVSLQPVMVPVDTILANQLGPNSNPLQSPAVTPMTYVSGFPELSPVGESNAIPLLSSNIGADINAPMTLSNPSLSFSSINDIVNEDKIKQQFTQPQSQPQSQPITQPSIENFNSNILKKNERQHRQPRMNKVNVNNNLSRANNNLAGANNNLAKYINNTASIEHFSPKKIEHFNLPKLSMMDNIVIAIVLFAFIYYIVSLKSDYSVNVDVSKIPIASQLADNNVSVENKIIIVLAVVIALVLIRKMLK